MAMLRSIYIFFISLMCCISFAQNWQLFPVNQLNHYRVDTENPAIRSFECDSAHLNDESIVHLFRRYNGFSDTCFWQNRNMFYCSNSITFDIDSLIYNYDSVIYYFTESGTLFDFVFKYAAKPGEEWDLSSHLGRTGTCNSVGVMDILGVTDSVKIFTLQTAVEDVQFIVSKTNGLIQFIPFIFFFYEFPTAKSTFPYYNLIGFESTAETQGFQFPGFAEYFHLSAGDLLLWKYTFYDMMDLTTHYYRDSLKASSLYPDSVEYKISRKVYDINAELIESLNTSIDYYRNEYEYFLQTPARWFTISNSDPYEEIYFIDNAYFVYSEIDTTMIKEFSADACIFQHYENECQIMCLNNFYDTEYKVSTIEGLTYLSEAYGREHELLGSVIDGVERGSMQIPVGLEQLSDCLVSIYPNPSSGIISLTNEHFIRQIEIYNPLGKMIYSGGGSREINLSGYPRGCYYFLIYTNLGKVYAKKLILVR